MMKKVPFRLLVLALCFPLLFSCSKDPEACSANWSAELQNELTAINTAVSVYLMDQSEENCDALKAAYQDYIDALRPYGKCQSLTGQSRTEWQNAINDAEESIDNIC